MEKVASVLRDKIVFTPSLRLLTLLVKRELKVKYRGSVLGYLWSMLNPLLFMLIISFVFSKLMRGIENYEIYVLAGILFWNMTAATIQGGTTAFVANAGLLLKVKVPTWIFALVPLGSALVNLLLAMIPYTIILFAKGLPLPPSILLLPAILALYAVFLSGISLALATANVFFRDVAHVIEPVMQLMFYATPIIYDRHSDLFPPNIQYILGLNPLTRFVELFRSAVFQTMDINPLVIAILACLAICSLAGGTMLFRWRHHAIAFKL